MSAYCQCLADPTDHWKTICGYIDQTNGLVYPCDPSRCYPSCPNPGEQPPGAVQFTKSDGVSLPDGFGKDLPVTEATDTSVGAPFWPVVNQPKNIQQIVKLLAAILLVILVSAFLA